MHGVNYAPPGLSHALGEVDHSARSPTARTPLPLHVGPLCEFQSHGQSSVVHKLFHVLDRWNRTIVRQLARTRNHTVRVKARVRARGVTGHQKTGLQYFNERRTELCRAKARAQQIWSLQLAGDWFPDYETKVPALRPHYMRVTGVGKKVASRHALNIWPPYTQRHHASFLTRPRSRIIFTTVLTASLICDNWMLTANLAVKDRMANGTAVGERNVT